MVDKFITELQARLIDKNIILTVNDEVRVYLALKGYDRLMGARPMARLIQDSLKKPLSQLILFGGLSEGGSVEAVMQEGAIKLKTKALATRKVTGKKAIN